MIAVVREMLRQAETRFDMARNEVESMRFVARMLECAESSYYGITAGSE